MMGAALAAFALVAGGFFILGQSFAESRYRPDARRWRGLLAWRSRQLLMGRPDPLAGFLGSCNGRGEHEGAR